MINKNEWLGAEKRRFPRAETRVPGRGALIDPEGVTGETEFEGMIVDVSHCGARFVSDDLPPDFPGEDIGGAASPSLRLKFHLPGNPDELMITGVITFFKDRPRAKPAYEFGIRLDSMDKSTQREWNKFLNTVLPFD